jgi:trans-aconitate 2-methyltransferase
MAHDWDGHTYDRISRPLEVNGLAVLERLELTGTETVIDAGCGSGRVTEALLERLPRGQVIAIDGAPGMIDAARARLGDRVEYIVGDLTELDLGGRTVDAVFSNAVFHWVRDQQGLYDRLRRVLRPDGRLVAQCGGQGNTPELVDATLAVGASPPYAEFLEDWCPWRFPGPRETAVRLERAGFTTIRTRLLKRPAPYEGLREWLRTNALSAHLLRLPAELGEPYIDAVSEKLGPAPTINYIRLDIDAVNPAS